MSFLPCVHLPILGFPSPVLRVLPAVSSSPADRATLAEPVGGSLLFAGEAAHTRQPSTVQGAFLSGVEQAGRIVAAMKFPAPGNATCTEECYGVQEVDVPLPKA